MMNLNFQFGRMWKKQCVSNSK